MRKLLEYYKNLPDKRIVLLQSGGLDSCVCAAVFKKCGFEISHVFVDYDQNSATQESQAAGRVVEQCGGTLRKVFIRLPWLSESCTLVDQWDEEDHSLEDKALSAVIGGAYVPFRNALLLSVAASLAEAKQVPYIGAAFDGSETLTHRPTGGTVDKHPYFVKTFDKLLKEGTAMSHVHGTPIQILTPVMDMCRPDIVRLGLDVNADMSASWSCYNNTDEPCGVCGACETRQELFEQFGIPHGRKK